MWPRLLQKKVVRFLLGGGIAAAFNLLLIVLLVEWIGFDTPILRNVANFISIELSLIASFFIYRTWVWPGGGWNLKQILGWQLPLYHVSAATAVSVRVFVVFPTLDWFGVNYAINTLFGIALSATINYIISDRAVFRHRPWDKEQAKGAYPQGLAPGLAAAPSALPKGSGARKLGWQEMLSVVIPAHNEEDCIAETVGEISDLLDKQKIPYEILVVNDNSRDGTEKVLMQLASDYPKMRYINSSYPNGFGFAVRCGLENFHGDAVVIVMADSSDAPEDIARYYDLLKGGFECVFGSRFIKGSRAIDYPPHKLVVNRLANWFIQILFGIKFNDTTNAFKAYRREVIEGISPLLSHHFNITVEMPLKAIARGYSYAVVPITWKNRTRGISKLKLKEMGSRYLFIVLYVFLERVLARRDYQRGRESLATQRKLP